MSRSEGVDALIRDYLLERGYDKAAAELAQEAKLEIQSSHAIREEKESTETDRVAAGAPIVQIKQEEGQGNVAAAASSCSIKPQTSTAQRIMSHIAEDVYVLGIKGGDAQQFALEYDAVRSWALDSIDFAKPQLLAITFPIFVHCYIGLVRTGYESEARTLLSQCRAHHAELHAEELDALSALTARHQLDSQLFLDSNKFISLALQSKFSVYMTDMAYQLLALFLVQHELVLVAAMLNTRVRFRRLHGAALEQAALDEGMLVELPGYSNGLLSASSSADTSSGTAASTGTPWNYSAVDFPSVQLGVPGNIDRIVQSLRQLSVTAAAAPSTKDDPTYRALVDHIVRPRAILSQINKRMRIGDSANSVYSTRAHSGVALSPAPEALDEYVVDAVKKKAGALAVPSLSSSSSLAVDRAADRAVKEERPAPAANALDTSAIFATVTNSYDGMICMDMTPDVAQMAAGFRDSTVKVWRLDELGYSNNSNSSGKRHQHQQHRRQSRFGMLLKSGWSARELVEVLPKSANMYEESSKGFISSAFASGSAVGRSSGGISGSSSSCWNNNGQGSSMLELVGHSKPVYGVSQDTSSAGSEGRLVLSCSADETVRLWDTYVCQCVGAYQCVSPPWDVQFSPLGYHFAVANQDRSATVFATDRISPLRLLKGHVSDVTCVSWHGNGLYLATGSDDKAVRLWDIRSAECVRVFRDSTTPISSLAISANGTLLAAGSDSGRAYVWDINSMRPLAILHGHDGPVHTMAFSKSGCASPPVGRQSRTDDDAAAAASAVALATGGADCSVRLWDMRAVLKSQLKLYTSRGIENPSSSSSSSSSRRSSTAGNKSGSWASQPEEEAAASGAADEASRAELRSSVTATVPQLVLRPRHSFFSKFAPVFHVGFTPLNLLYAGGPCSVNAMTTDLKGSSHGGLDATGATADGAVASASASEQETVTALGISRAVVSYH